MIRAFKSSDMKELNHWHEGHSMPQIPRRALPKVGFIVPGIAAGFLYQTDSAVALLEGFIANPESSYEERNLALDSITEALEAIARELGFSYLSAMTSHLSIQRRAEKHGFHYVRQLAFLSKEIG